MFRALLVIVTALALALAGCSSSPSDGKPANPGGFVATKETGIIQGVVVDVGIRPIAGAQIALTGQGPSQNATSDEAGYFGFAGLTPGTWFISVSKPSYEPAQQSVEVVAGVSNPPVAKIQLIFNEALRPYSDTFVWSGFLQCSAGVPVVQASINPCFFSPESSNVHDLNLSEVPSFVQAEMVWKPGTAVGTSFILSAFVPTDDLDDVDGVDDYAEAQGTSPLIVRIDGELLANKTVGAGEQLSFRVFPGQDQPTAFANQAFTVYITIFHGYTPPAEWTFGADGPLDPNSG